jgi:hypothetical protein
VNSADILKKILSIDTLLSFDGVIPSLSEFQLKLVTLIKQFGLTLQSEGHSETEVDRLCHQICHYLDKRATSSIKENGLSWQGYSLVHYFYGYVAPCPDESESLEALLNSKDATISQYALKILALSQNLPIRDEKSLQLLARYSHISSRQSAIATDDIDPELALEPELKMEETIETEEAPEANKLPEQRRILRPFYLQFVALAVLLSILWFWCSRYLGGLS